MEKRCLHFFSAVLDWILLILAGNDYILRAWMSLKFGQIQPLVSMVIDRVMMGKKVSPLFSAVFHLFLFILAGNYDMHKSSDEFEFRPNWITNCGVSCP